MLESVDRATLRHCLQHEGNHERGSWTDHSLKDKVEADRALPQRTPAMCVELSLGRQVGRRHPCDCGCRLGRRPEDKVLNVWRSIGNWPVHHGTSLVVDTGNTEQAGYAGERGRLADKTRATSSSGLVGRNDGLLIPW